MGRFDRKLFLPNYHLHVYHGVRRPVNEISIYNLFDGGGQWTVVLRTKEDMEFCEALALMYGRKLNTMYLWDWHDKVYGAMYERPRTMQLDDFFHGMVSDHHDLVGIVDKPHIIHKMRKDEEERQLYLASPQPYFNPKEMLFI